VVRVWGQPLGGKAQLTIIRHQGSPDETQQLITVDLATAKPTLVTLEGGRRKELAYVPPPSSNDLTTATEPIATTSPDRVLNQLRALADPEVTGFNQAPRGGGYALGFEQPKEYKAPKPSDQDKTLIQQRVASFVRNSVEVTAQAQLTSDRRGVRLTFQPAFNTVGVDNGQPAVNNPVIPGGQ
jgi:hypothetical protein